MHTKPLTVYKASAGSGKTFTLAVEYIKLMVSNPLNYRYTLAVTFTNKATQEMKQRILSKLYGIAHDLPDAADYYARVAEAFPQLTERVIRSRAGEALAMLVRDYNLFRIETIDSFFQRVLRNLARELGLTANLQVMLNDNEVESQAVDNIISNIELDSDPLLAWIMDFVNERMADDKSWNVTGQIKEFGKNIFTDFYKDHQAELRAIMDDAAFFKQYTSSLRALKGKALADMKGFADRYSVIAGHYGLTDANYTHGHSNAPGYFDNLANGNFLGDKPKMPNSYIAAGLDDPRRLVKKGDLDKPETAVIVNEVAPLLKEAEAARQKAAVTVNSVDLTLQNVNQLRLLGRIEEEVARINALNNDYPLSNTQKLLSNLIDRQDSPFIYEKIGGQLHYIMIDEFQDTSTVQWENFKVLLDDCIAHNAGSLIVGDVKQSIYRWRDGDWRLLQNLNEKNFPQTLTVKNLAVNYRSTRNVVSFNNDFFNTAADITAIAATDSVNASAAQRPQAVTDRLLGEAYDIKEAYADVAQKVPDGREKAGLVSVSLIPSDDYDSRMIAKVRETLEMLLGNGVPYNKIAVIVRKNKHIKLIADYFQHNAVNVNGEERMVSMVSDEAFRIDASLAVNVIVSAMKLLTHPGDNLTKAFLAKAYQNTSPNREAEAEILVVGEDTDKYLPPDMTAKRTELLSMPLVDLAQRIYDIFHLSALNGQSSYVCAFFDQLSAYLKKRVAGIDDFLKEWDEELCDKSIHSDEIDGIRLLTVHKSKGLEFDNVIVPYCDWKIEDSRDILWAEPKQKPYSELPVVPINIQGKKLQGSIYADDYESEHIKCLVDNLNILYVAFTRASRNLFVIGKKGSNDFPSKLINDVMDCMPDGELRDDDETGEKTFTFGTLCQSEEKARHDTANIFEQPEQGLHVTIETTRPKAHFLQSNASADFMTPPNEAEERKERQAYIDTGNILHKLLASIHDFTEVDAAIDKLEYDGVLYERPMTREQLKACIHQELGDPQVRAWFSPRWRVFNECSILCYDEAKGHVVQQRPDRVIYDGHEMIVIDFKTGRELERHKAQVRGYMRLLSDMGYGHITGYLWYIHHHKIVKV